MKKFKLLGVFFALLLVFGVVRVNAADVTIDGIKNYVKTKSMYGSFLTDEQSLTTTPQSGNNVVVTLKSESLKSLNNGSDTISVTVNFSESTGIFEYPRPSDAGDLDGAVIDVIVDAICDIKGYSTSECSSTILKNNVSTYNYDKYGIEGTVANGVFTHIKIDSKNMSLTGNRSVTTTTTETSTVTNPKTGVFVPIVGLSVLIIASVVCLLWVSKNNIFRGI